MADSVSGVSNTSGVNETMKYSTTTSTKNDSLNMQDFLMLIVAQMQNQGMDSTQNNGEFMSQMAQIASMQAMQELTASFMSSMAVSFVGKYVSAEATVSGGARVAKEGFVERVNFNGGDVMLLVDDVWFKTNDIYEISDKEIVDEEITNSD